MSRRNPKIESDTNPSIDPAIRQRRKLSETLASIGMVLIAAGLMFPLFNMLDMAMISIFKWVFAAGAVLFFGARCIPTTPKGAPVKLRRLKHMQFWAGACFLVAAGLWFYNQYSHAATMYVGPLAILRDSILFSLAGAVIQLISTWMIYFFEKKHSAPSNE